MAGNRGSEVAARRTVARTALAAFAVLGAVVSPPLAAPAGAAATTLGGAAAATGRYFGAAVGASHLGEAPYAAVLDREFTSVTPENEMHWDAVEPVRGQFNFTPADAIVAHAQSKGMRVRGHSLVDSPHTAWTGNLLTAQDTYQALTAHIAAVAGHFRGKIHSWDVVNEAFADSGGVRPGLFQRRLGDSYIETAFRAARAADPAARLCLNDYGIEDPAAAKTRGVLALVKDFKARGVPIDCVGLESHFTATTPVPAGYAQTIAQFAALGVEVQITELDIEGSGAAQAQAYGRAVTACVTVPRCTGITVWGVTDRYSWRSGGTPLPFDRDYNKKQAYYAALSAFAICGGRAAGAGAAARAAAC
ncbi:endo-1,4-beta-xylanase [Sphaerisporangium sp. NPDC004334]